jgi:predicted DCC family thiol-disulfide oxidoreductase YuxK
VGAIDPRQLVVLYDGTCGLCHRLVTFLVLRDRGDVLRFAPLQGELAAAVLQRHSLNAEDLETIYVVEDFGGPTEKVGSHAAAVLLVLRRQGGALAALAWVLSGLPSGLLRWGYRQVAQRRYRIFGRYSSCFVPTAEQRSKFL